MDQWLKYLRNEFPTIAFKASTQSQKQNLVSELIIIILYILCLFSLFIAYISALTVNTVYTKKNATYNATPTLQQLHYSAYTIQYLD